MASLPGRDCGYCGYWLGAGSLPHAHADLHGDTANSRAVPGGTPIRPA